MRSYLSITSRLGNGPTRGGIEKHVRRRHLAIANDDHILARVVGRLAARPRSKSQVTGIVGPATGMRVYKVPESRADELARRFIERFAPSERAGQDIQPGSSVWRPRAMKWEFGERWIRLATYSLWSIAR